MLSACADEYEAKHAFSAFANWVIPGRLMVGRYPYVEGSRCRCSCMAIRVSSTNVHSAMHACMRATIVLCCSSREQGEAQLKQLLETGLTTFICLQARRTADLLGCMCQSQVTSAYHITDVPWCS